ncbi:MAG: sugar ABC transporter ATP-binding protein [Planctomycetota bacterium]|jgi:ABC-type sugar transport system ATPase subunit|nr:sugar ABC transporter ATP-binding protein [Planctomycetota bacterium]
MGAKPETAGTPVLKMQGIDKAFAGNPVVRRVDFSCLAGEIHGLVGENGAGKSTLMKILAGIYQPDAGNVILNGREVAFRNYGEAREAGICVVYQELSLLPQMSVAENIFMGRWRRGRAGLVNWPEIRKEARLALEKVGLGDLDVNRLVSSLPMAVRQLIEVAKALLYEPRAVVFDEPTTTLTGSEAARLFGLMRELRNQGKGIIFISHRLKEILGVSDRITIMKDGERVLTGPAADFDENKLIYHMIGRDLTQIFPKKPVQLPDRIIFSCSAVAPGGGKIEFSVREGEVLGIGGLNGQGQVPFLESIFGLETGAEVSLHGGSRIRVKSPRDAMRVGISLIPEDRNAQSSFPILSIRNNIASASLARLSAAGFLKTWREKRDVRKIAEELQIRMASLSQEVRYLSGGNVQKTVFARWLLASPKVMVLLSPTSGIDVGTKQQIYRLIRELAAGGVAIIVLTGDMVELIGLCDRVLVMYGGRVSGELSGSELTEENIMRTSMGRTGGEGAA